MVSGSSAVSDSLLEAFRALQSSLRPFRGVFLQDTLFLSKMSTTPDQLVVPVQPDGADKLDSDTEELADGLASKMAAPAANAEAADGLPEQQQEEGEPAAAAISPPPAPAAVPLPASDEDDEFDSVHQSHLGSPSPSVESTSSSAEEYEEDEAVMTSPQAPVHTAGESRLAQLQSMAVGDGNTQGGGSFMLNESSLSPPVPRRTASDAKSLLEPVLAEQDQRIDKIETAVADLAVSQREARLHQQATAEAAAIQMAQMLAMLSQKMPAAPVPNPETSAAGPEDPAPAAVRPDTEPQPASAEDNQQPTPPTVTRGGSEAGLASVAQPMMTLSGESGKAPSDRSPAHARHSALAQSVGVVAAWEAPDSNRAGPEMGLMGGGVGDTRLEGRNGSRQQLSTDTQSSASSSEPTDRPASAGLKPETKSLSHLPSNASVVPSLPCVATADAAPAELDRSLAEMKAEAAIAMLRYYQWL